MSALEPDAPAPHVFPHVREMLRAWWSHRQGRQPSRAATGDVRGKGPGVSDLLTVGRLLVDLGHLAPTGDLSPSGERLLRYAMGAGGAQRDDTKLHAAVKRLTRHARDLRIVAEAVERPKTHRMSWVDSEGTTHIVSILLDHVSTECSG